MNLREAQREFEPVAWMRPDRGHICFHKYPGYIPLYIALSERKHKIGNKMDDHELLQLAAEAAKIKLVWYGEKDPWCFAERFPGIKWNPLDDDGDALRLAVKLEIVVEYRREVPACFAYHYALNLEVMQRNDQLDSNDATRRAIVRVAAEIGKMLPRLKKGN